MAMHHDWRVACRTEPGVWNSGCSCEPLTKRLPTRRHKAPAAAPAAPRIQRHRRPQPMSRRPSRVRRLRKSIQTPPSCFSHPLRTPMAICWCSAPLVCPRGRRSIRRRARIVGTPADTDVGETADITVSVSDGETTARLTAFRVKVRGKPPAPTPPPPSNLAPVIGGAPATSVQATLAYSFAPTAIDPEGQTLASPISNKPSWAAFSTTTGRLCRHAQRQHRWRLRQHRHHRVRWCAQRRRCRHFRSLSPPPPTARRRSLARRPLPRRPARPIRSPPQARTRMGNALTYSIANKPSWASFSTIDRPAFRHTGQHQRGHIREHRHHRERGALSARWRHSPSP